MKRPWALPLVPLYAAGTVLRSIGLRLGLERVQSLAKPVVSVGGISSGGAGKTPFVIALAKLMQQEGIEVDVLSRGYGRSGNTVERVDSAGDAGQFGDEPLLISRGTGVPVFVAPRRYDAGKLAESAYPQAKAHLLDDGFQHRQLQRDLDIVLVSSDDLNDVLLPAGNSREGFSALRRAGILAVRAEDAAAIERLKSLGLTQAIVRYRRTMVVPKIEGRAFAFCGIALPEQFFSGLEAAGVSIAGRLAFSDHHRFRSSDIDKLQNLITQSGATVAVTTEKDDIRLGSLAAEISVPIEVVELELELLDRAAVLDILNRIVSRQTPDINDRL